MNKQKLISTFIVDDNIEAIAVLQAQQNLVLTEIKTRLEFLIEGKQKRKKSDG